MVIDQVHDLQTIFRKVLHTLSRPGEIESIQFVGEKSESIQSIYETTFLVLNTLFDNEINFHLITESSNSVIDMIIGYTLARFTSIEQADFIVVLQDADEAKVVSAIEQCKKGTLIEPNTSSTWIIETSFSKQDGRPIHLTGPGIKDQKHFSTTLSDSIWRKRNQHVVDYPLGIDFILIDNEHQIAGIPRTTKVEVK